MILLYLVVINLIAFAAMGWDKSSAVRGVERIPERTLLTLAAVGGSVGAVAAQQVFRHKTRKQPFATWLGLIFSLYVLALLTAAALVVWKAFAV